MLDQSFSTENLRRIFDLENRTGNYLEGRFFPHIEKITQRIKDKKRDLRKLNAERGKYAPDVFQAKRAALYDKLNSLKEKKEKQFGKALEGLNMLARRVRQRKAAILAASEKEESV